jgi:SAM-dependent methyltransferase
MTSRTTKVADSSRALPAQVARAYDHVGSDYGDYADGEGTERALEAEPKYAHADAQVWVSIRTAIDDVKASGALCIRILDAGSGPGLWTMKMADYAGRLGLAVEAIGCDISKVQLAIAQEKADEVCGHNSGRAAMAVRFMVQDLRCPLPWCDGHFDLVVSNFAVLNHLRSDELPSAVAELCRVARRRVISTFRALGSPPTACIVGLEDVASYRLDLDREELSLVLRDGSRHVMPFNLYSAAQIRRLFESRSKIIDLRAINLFNTRFAADDNWNESRLTHSRARRTLLANLKEMEEPLCRLPGWIDHGTHVLVIAEPNATERV